MLRAGAAGRSAGHERGASGSGGGGGVLSELTAPWSGSSIVLFAAVVLATTMCAIVLYVHAVVPDASSAAASGATPTVAVSAAASGIAAASAPARSPPVPAPVARPAAPPPSLEHELAAVKGHARLLRPLLPALRPAVPLPAFSATGPPIVISPAPAPAPAVAQRTAAPAPPVAPAAPAVSVSAPPPPAFVPPPPGAPPVPAATPTSAAATAPVPVPAPMSPVAAAAACVANRFDLSDRSLHHSFLVFASANHCGPNKPPPQAARPSSEPTYFAFPPTPGWNSNRMPNQNPHAPDTAGTYRHGVHPTAHDPMAQLTVVTQLTLDRLPQLQLLLSRVVAPARVSAALYVVEKDFDEALKFAPPFAWDGPLRPVEECPDFLQPITLPPHVTDPKNNTGCNPTIRSALTYDPQRWLDAIAPKIAAEHPWLFTTPTLHVHLVVGSLRVLYPINALRNIAWHYVTTTHAFLLDVDFTVSANFFGVMRYLGLPPREQVWVLPCYSAKCRDLKDLSTCVRTDAAAEVTYQGATDLHLWEQYTGSVNADVPADDFDALARRPPMLYGVTYRIFYEPYIIGSARDMPRYDARFQGRGNDKMQQLYAVAAQGFTFQAVTQAYIFQTPHALSKGWTFGGAFAPESSSRSWQLLLSFFRYHATAPWHYRHFCDSYASQALYSTMYTIADAGPKLFVDVCGQSWVDNYVAGFQAGDKKRRAEQERALQQRKADEAAAKAKAATAAPL